MGLNLSARMNERSRSNVWGPSTLAHQAKKHCAMEHMQADVYGALLQVGMFVHLQIQTGISTGTLPLGKRAKHFNHEKQDTGMATSQCCLWSGQLQLLDVSGSYISLYHAFSFGVWERSYMTISEILAISFSEPLCLSESHVFKQLVCRKQQLPQRLEAHSFLEVGPG